MKLYDTRIRVSAQAGMQRVSSTYAHKRAYLDQTARVLECSLERDGAFQQADKLRLAVTGEAGYQVLVSVLHDPRRRGCSFDCD